MNPCGLSRTEETWSRLDEPIDAEFERRRAELDQELKAMGTHVIQVQDLGAALEAREAGTYAVVSATVHRAGEWNDPIPPEVFARSDARHAAHLARQALGEVGS